MKRRRDLRSETGSTLVEMLVSIVILGIAGVAILAGLQLSVTASDIHRKQTTDSAYVRNYAEAIEQYLETSGNYVKCAGPNTYSPAVVGLTAPLPSGYSAVHSAAEPLAGDGLVITAGSCPGRDQGVQRLKLRVAGLDNRGAESLTIVVRRACDTGSSCG